MIARKLQELPDAQRPRQVVTLHGRYETMTLPELLVCLPALEHVDHFTYAAPKHLGHFPTSLLSKTPFTHIDMAVPPSKGDPGTRHREELRARALSAAEKFNFETMVLAFEGSLRNAGGVTEGS